MRYLILTLLAVASFALPAHAKLGETRGQLLQRFGKAACVKQDANAMVFKGKNTVIIGLYNDRSVVEAYFLKGKADYKTFDEIVSVVIAPNAKQYDWVNHAGVWTTSDGRYSEASMESDDKTNCMIVIGEPEAVQGFLEEYEPTKSANQATPAPATTPRVEPRSRSPKDCLIVATEAQARLSKSAYWSRIAGFVLSNNGKLVAGHAVVFYQPTSSSDVFIYDEDGSLDLHTRTHELTEIIDAYNSRLQRIRSTWRASSKGAHWVSDDNAQPAVTAATPAAESPASDTPALTTAAAPSVTPVASKEIPLFDDISSSWTLWGKQTAIYVILYAFLGLRITGVVVCGMKGKNGMATLGCIISGLFAIVGAIRIAKPTSWWARKYYGPEKMKIALQRFAHLYKDSTRKGIEQSIQVIDISRKVQA